ncbi:AlpA family transcriptional regulator [Duganella sp. Root1480D1]|uniref:helix-turn-helix transcriptional regulator n=1 Tax=Duganella sp. Root1480D1 TaxID=1736471 RepID=UPI0009E7BBCD|nr:AlpA family phage regulatory protein [Duganella sp. Root1480D1]
MNVSNTLPKAGYVRISGLIPAILPFSAATLWRKVADGSFPRPLKLSAGVTAWRWEDIHDWMFAIQLGEIKK